MPNPKILIVEDDVSMSKVLELKLARVGFDTKAVFTGEEALKILEDEKFDLILLDLILPMMNGFEVIEKMNKRDDKTPIIVLSNLGQEEDIKKAKDLGAATYIVKTKVPLEEMVSKIKKVLTK